MSSNLKRTFDAVRMSPEGQEKIRGALSSRFSEKQEEDIMTHKKFRAPHILAIAAVLVLVMGLVGFSYGGQIIHLLGGGRVTQGPDGQGGSLVSADIGFAADPVEIRDGQVYFVLDGSDANITADCSDETYYRYESHDAHGNRRVVLIGGTPEDLGWAEFVWSEDGEPRAANATYSGDAEPQWLIAGKLALNV